MMSVNYLSTYDVTEFLREYDAFLEKGGLEKHAFGFALARSYITATPANIAFLTFMLENRSLFVTIKNDEETN